MTNRVLRALSAAERRRLEPHFVRVALPSGKVLYTAGDTMRYAFFPLDGVISLLASTADGAAAEVALVGNDGLIGVPILLPVNTALVAYTAANYWQRSAAPTSSPVPFRRRAPNR